MQIETVACVGAGIIGRSWAVVFARRAKKVLLYDSRHEVAEAAKAWIDRAVGESAETGLSRDAVHVRDRIQVVDTMEEAVSSADYVQESALEDLVLKASLFSDIDRVAPRQTILASSTSGFPPSMFLANLAGRRRCLVAHPLNPPHLIPAVEICPTPFTSPQAVEATMSFLRQTGQHPFLLKREVHGFVMNRLQLAVLREALSLIERDICTVADLDVAMKYGLARRWAVMGPFETNYLTTTGGYAHFLAAYGETLKNIADDLCSTWNFDETLGREVDAQLTERLNGETKEATEGRRNRNLIRLARTELEG